MSLLLRTFLMPLGVTCVLLGAALVLGWRRSRWTPLPVALALLILWVSSNGWVANGLVSSLERRHITPDSELHGDVIVVLGGGVEPAIWPRTGVEVEDAGDRVIYAARLYRRGRAPLLITTGGFTGLSEGKQHTEATDAADLLVDLGVPRGSIVTEQRSRSTLEDARFVTQLLRERALKRPLLVTSAMHMPRSVMLFRKEGVEVIPAPTDFLVAGGGSTGRHRSVGASLLPRTDAFGRSSAAVKELFGLLYQSGLDEGEGQEGVP